MCVCVYVCVSAQTCPLSPPAIWRCHLCSMLTRSSMCQSQGLLESTLPQSRRLQQSLRREIPRSRVGTMSLQCLGRDSCPAHCCCPAKSRNLLMRSMCQAQQGRLASRSAIGEGLLDPKIFLQQIHPSDAQIASNCESKTPAM